MLESKNLFSQEEVEKVLHFMLKIKINSEPSVSINGNKISYYIKINLWEIVIEKNFLLFFI